MTYRPNTFSSEHRHYRVGFPPLPQKSYSLDIKSMWESHTALKPACRHQAIARTMNYFLEFIVCLVTFAMAEGLIHETTVITGEDALLPCAAKSKEGVQYRSVIWYKVAEGPSRTLTGIVMKRLTENNGKVQKYKGFEREVELLDITKSLILSNVTAEDSGIYSCFLSAPLGHQNQEGEIVLNVNEYPSLEQMEFNKSDYHVMAFAVLFVALLMFCISYVCLRSVFQSNKKLLKDSLLKMPHLGKNLIVTKHLDCKTLPEVFV